MHVFKRGEKIVPVDYHIHTTYSDGQSSIESYIIRAKELGLKEIAITDHIWRTSEWVDDYVNEIRELSEKHNFKVHAGLEAKAIDLDGNVDISKSDRKKVDFVMGVVHRRLPDEDSIFKDLFNLNPLKIQEIEVILIKRMILKGVDIIGHPMRTFYKFKQKCSIDFDLKPEFICKIADYAAKMGAILEWNIKLPGSLKILNFYLEKGSLFTIGTDSHSCEDLGSVNYAKINEVVSRWRG
ncbi:MULTISPECIES: PHP domain-containing protein [unclassified Archaeoglobus]|uniref:PHP domain-containing protein n=1 Tax=unclassified Archaeoglobus TaxID=2643606 RepID=UPI0025BF0A77|nr:MULTISPECIES: PHP domain-containing protein [unclassified Archaeoglobus]